MNLPAFLKEGSDMLLAQMAEIERLRAELRDVYWLVWGLAIVLMGTCVTLVWSALE